MSDTKPSIPKGTRDFTPLEMSGRNFIFQTVRTVFEKYGYMPIETPAMENLTTLMGKYGDEGDKLLFKILNSGDYLSKIDEKGLNKTNSLGLSSQICDRGLRYDLTVPFARFVVQHRNEINFPFKRYQIQPVWRADRPQKGRYREFYQCDVDVIGSNSLLNEADLLCIIKEVFEKLGIKIVIKLNNRKILAGIAEMLSGGSGNQMLDFTVSLDKLDKIGREKVLEELKAKDYDQKALDTLSPLLDFIGNKDETIKFLKEFLKDSETGLKGLAELEEIIRLSKLNKLEELIELDLTLARGLNYYTGAIIEVKALDVQIGSVCGGGRYDDLTGIFGMPDVSGVGISFGADRINDVMNQLHLFPVAASTMLKLLFVNFGAKEAEYILPLLAQVRNANISAEIYPDASKMKKQMNYANSNNVPFVAIVGENEIKNNVISLKNMQSGEQKDVSIKELIDLLKI
jgi:histidyl-tRNA synthetase